MLAPRSMAWLRAGALLWIGLLAGFAGGIEWIRSRPRVPEPSGGIDLVGAGATFPYPLYRRWFAEYATATGVRINYFSLGSGEGIRLLLEDEVDFGATDRPLRADESARATCGPLILPMVLGNIAVVVNLPGVAAPLHLDADALAAIYRGVVTTWDAPSLRRLNPGVRLPALPIQAVRRARSSGTSTVFAQYLSSAAGWPVRSGNAETEWPVGDAVEGNEGVAAQVRATPGAIGFVEQAYATQSRLTIAALRNAADHFVLPDSASLATTIRDLVGSAIPDTLAGLIGAGSAQAYPVVAITRLVADRALGDAHRAGHFLAFARWAIIEGGPAATALGFAPLPTLAASDVRRRLDRVVPGRCPMASEMTR